MAPRMTTLHEEPLRHNPLQEENEDSYSDPEFDYDKPSGSNPNDYYAKSRMRSSHTIDSFMDIEKKTSTTSTNLLNYRLLTQNQTFHIPQSAKSQEKPLKNGKLESVIAASSPSMNSSTSSGYGSQAVSISNLTNEDALSLQSMSAEEQTPGKFLLPIKIDHFNNKFNCNILDFDRISSTSPPRKDSAPVYTPSSGQKRFNPFMKDTMGKNQDDDSNCSTPQKSNTSPTHKKPLTPTNDHPLMDLVAQKQNTAKFELMDDYDDDKDDVMMIQTSSTTDDIKPADDTNTNTNNKILPELDNHQHQMTSETDEDTTNNNNRTTESIDVNEDNEMDQQKLTPGQVVRRRKSPSRTSNNNNANIKNNNRMSYPITRDRSQPRIEDGLTKSTDRLDGEFKQYFCN